MHTEELDKQKNEIRNLCYVVMRWHSFGLIASLLTVALLVTCMSILNKAVAQGSEAQPWNIALIVLLSLSIVCTLAQVIYPIKRMFCPIGSESNNAKATSTAADEQASHPPADGSTPQDISDVGYTSERSSNVTQGTVVERTTIRTFGYGGDYYIHLP